MSDSDGVEFVFDDGLVVVSVHGELDMASAPRLDATLQLIDAPRRVVVDMADVDFIDSSGLNVILAHSRRLSEARGSLLVRQPSAVVRGLLRLTKFDAIIEDQTINHR